MTTNADLTTYDEFGNVDVLALMAAQRALRSVAARAAARLVDAEARYPDPRRQMAIGDTSTGRSSFSGRSFAHRFEGMTEDGLAEFSGIQL